MIKVYVNHKKQEVYAVITGCAEDAYKFLQDKAGDKIVNINPKALMNDTYKATAKCFKGDGTHEADAWNEELGTAIAKERVTEKYNKAFNAAVAVIEQDMKDSLNKLTEAFNARQILSNAHMTVQKEYNTKLLKELNA